MSGQSDVVDDPSVSSIESTKKKKSVLKPLILLIVLAALFVLAAKVGIREKLEELQVWIDTIGAWAPVVFVLVYIAATVLMAPGSVLTLAAGALFGSFFGVLYTIIAATIGASFAFLIARYFARDSISGWLGKSKNFKKLDDLTGEHGNVIVAITRLVPVFPFNLLNYMFGLTKVPFWTYVFWSFLCMLPGTILYVVGTDALVTGLREGKVPWLLVGVLIVMFAIIFGLVRSARAKLQKPSEK